MMETVSVVVPVYNCEKYIKKCVESILSQTYPEIEIILVNDGSTDKSGVLCDYYAGQESTIKTIHQDNKGVSSARNRGIETASGKYLMFVDCDDYIDRDLIQHAVRKIEEFSSDLFISGLVIETISNGKITRTEKKKIESSRLYSITDLLEDFEVKYPIMCLCGPCCKLYLTSIIRDNNISFEKNMNFGEDSNFNFSYLHYVKTAYFSEETGYHYFRENLNSLFSRFHRDCYEVHRLVYSKFMDLILDNRCTQKTLSRFEKMYSLSMIGSIIEYYANYDKTSKLDRVNQIKKVSKDELFLRCSLNGFPIHKKGIIALIKNKYFWIIDKLFILKYASKKSQDCCILS